jgi:multisubunit Na+/H+ antiporter MnhG subunit
MLASRRRDDPALVNTLVVTSIAAMAIDTTFGVLTISGAVTQIDAGLLRLLAVLVIVMLLTSVLPTILRRISFHQGTHPASRECIDGANHVA